ncbi:MOSC domain-containing protein [Clohesyomyces aquaticus]|uniref:MOSC domain-containing protein n=1 Tax=Clohesyomyces aquaticus TaxID=1231657 RepID=A0A1Y1Z0K1_9PLEO|nr:MOSC domain-containing protein [Clohesyomyces aquaticus]
MIDSARALQERFGSSLSLLTIGITLIAIFIPFRILYFYAHTEERLPPPPGCRKLGLSGPSNLSDQYSKQYSQGAEPSPSNPWKVKALFIYPLKSCAGVELDESDVIRTGLKYDRQFTLGQYVTGLPSLEGKVESEWTFITQRTFPRLAKVETEIWVPDPETEGYAPDAEYVKSEGCIVVRFPFSPDTEWSLEGLRAYWKILSTRLRGKAEPMLEFRVPFNPPKERIKAMKYRSEKIKIWKDMPEALDVGCEVPEEMMAKLKYTLGVTNPLSLFRIDANKFREVYKNAPKKADVGFQTIIGMADSYPMHIMNLASVHHVSSQLPRGSKPLNALRYRANVYITGPPAFDEDNWAKLRIGDGAYHISCRTTRCKLPNVDPETGIADRNEPGTTMRKYRVIDEGSQSACLGMQVTPLKEGDVAVGDRVEVLGRGKHYFLKG